MRKACFIVGVVDNATALSDQWVADGINRFQALLGGSIIHSDFDGERVRRAVRDRGCRGFVRRVGIHLKETVRAAAHRRPV